MNGAKRSLELIVFVSAVVAAAVGIAICFSGTVYSNTLTDQADHDLKLFQSALEQYKKIGGQYPTNEQGLMAMMKEPKTDPQPVRWAQLFESPESFIDPWKIPYRYRVSGSRDPSRPEIISAGPDKTFGTDDDQSNQD